MIYSGLKLWKKKDGNWRKLLVNMAFVTLPLLAIIFSFTIRDYMFINGEYSYIFKLHSAQYEKDINEFYKENISKVTMDKGVYKIRHKYSSFPAYQVKYELSMNQDSSYLMMARYYFNPYPRNSSWFIYFSADSTYLLNYDSYRKPGDEIYPLGGKWYYCMHISQYPN
jgi:hypothetical protein